MGYRLAADGVVVVHLAYLVFLVVGSLLAWRRPRLVWLHVPAMAWGLVSITLAVDCPLTVIEKHFRRLAGDEGYAGGFIDHYVAGVVYPESYLPLIRVLIAVAILAGYVGLARRARRRDQRADWALSGGQRA